MSEHQDRNLARELFEEDDWRALWWELIFRITRSENYPETEDDIHWLAFGAEAAVRHHRFPVIRRLVPAARRAVSSPMIRNIDPALVRMLIGLLNHASHPAYAMDLESGPWSIQSLDWSRDEISRLMERDCQSVSDLIGRACEVSSHRLWFDWEEQGYMTLAVSRGSMRRPSLREQMSLVNQDLQEGGLPEIRLDGTGHMYLDLCNGNDKEVRCNSIAMSTLRESVLRVTRGYGLEAKNDY